MSDLTHKEVFNYHTKDKAGHHAAAFHGLVGTRWQHFGNGRDYTILSVEWCGDTDLWHIRHRRDMNSPVTTRSIDNFFGEVAGVPRFRKVG